jgi:hypothetical protein
MVEYLPRGRKKAMPLAPEPNQISDRAALEATEAAASAAPPTTSDDSDDNPWPWPDHSIKLFEGGSLWGIHGLDTLEAWELYAEGYKRAAELLFADRENWHNTYLLFPMLFLYRHYVELRIKHMLCVSIHYPGIPALPKGWKLNHKLQDVWELLRPRLLAASPDIPEKELDNVGSLIGELHKKDPGSFVFRYPTNRLDPTSRSEGNFLSDSDLDLNSLNIINYFDSMRQLSEILDTLGGCMHEVVRQQEVYLCSDIE